ncbi:MAG: DUF192 domain-containing protein [Candidatus Levyibacteriota bacterium]|jgi:uncharacterized membrane protein (UPF0127 family)
MKIPIFILGTLIILILVFLMLTYLEPKAPSAQINGHVFSLYLAETSQEQEIGLAKYKSIAKDQGMIFLFNKSDYYSFWMKDMKFPIDIIFISGNKVVDVFQKVPVSPNENLPVYTTRTKADKVLEINAGLTKKYGIKIGSNVKINL